MNPILCNPLNDPVAVTVLRWSPDHLHLAVGTRDGTVAVWPGLGRAGE